MASVLDSAHFKTEAAAYKWVEARVWPNGRVCPHCGVVDNSGPLKGKSTRLGVYKCYEKDCRKPFTVKVGTIFEKSHIPMHIWLQAMFLLASSKKGISSNQLARTLGVTLKSAWFLSHRIREAMKEPSGGAFGGRGGEVEIDETFLGRDPDKELSGTAIRHMNQVLTLIDRRTGRARSMIVTEFTQASVREIMDQNIVRSAIVLTDEAHAYRKGGKLFGAHKTVNHAKDEYVSKDDPRVHTNTVEGYFSVFKRGMRGVYQHCSKAHLHRYCIEFDFRYSNRIKLGVDDVTRFSKIVEGVKGKRLTYRNAGGEVRAET